MRGTHPMAYWARAKSFAAAARLLLLLLLLLHVGEPGDLRWLRPRKLRAADLTRVDSTSIRPCCVSDVSGEVRRPRVGMRVRPGRMGSVIWDVVPTAEYSVLANVAIPVVGMSPLPVQRYTNYRLIALWT